MRTNKLVTALAVAGLATISTGALATNGYFSHGYGMTAKGMAGAATAITGDTFGGANNPATMVWAGNRLDVGLDWFSPKRDVSRSGSTFIDASSNSDKTNFFIPEFGYNKMLSNTMSLGVTVYGNGGMNTDYPGGEITSVGGTTVCNNFQTGGLGVAKSSYNVLCGDGRLGVDLMQLIVAPTFSVKVAPNHSIGVSPLIGYQRFKAEGLQGFVGFSASPSNLTNNGYDTSSGWGVRVGYYGQITDTFSIGAAYASEMRMSKFDKYKGLFAEQGGFNLPENYNVGVAWKFLPAFTAAIDWQHISYDKIASIANPQTNYGTTAAGSLGPNNGRGFGWSGVDVWKFGLEYSPTKKITWRAGYSSSDNPISGRDVTFNFLAPGVIKEHYTLGMSYALNANSELTVSYMHAVKNSVSGQSLYATFGLPASSQETITLKEDSLGVAYGMKF